MLHHERQVLLNCKRNTIGLIKTDGKQVARIKSTILDCLSCYSFETVSDDAITQLVYEKYKGILKLPLLEENMSNLIFKLDDEIGKKKEAKRTLYSHHSFLSRKPMSPVTIVGSIFGSCICIPLMITKGPGL